ncbi:MAG: hypothetical protein OK438_08535 [Thaumarchaeota archaeon]|nr:hypothetical protein [Nitrososphaerota archaeon]
MSPYGKVSVLVKSRRVPVRTVTLVRPIYSSSGLFLGSQTQQAVVYDTAFDESHAKAIREGRRLSCNLSLDFEVVDRSKVSPFRRLLSRFARSAEEGPSLVLSPSSAVAAR